MSDVSPQETGGQETPGVVISSTPHLEDERFSILKSQEAQFPVAVSPAISGGILDTPFRNIRPPTAIELEPLNVNQEAIEQPADEIVEVPAAEKSPQEFVVDSRIINYLHGLSVSAKERKLASLLFDVKYSHSVEHIREILESAESAGKITAEEKKTMLDLLGDSSPTAPQTIQAEPNEQRITINKQLTTESVERIKELDNKLALSRTEYVNNLVVYLKSVRLSRASFTKVMSDLGADRHMPLPDESTELKEARKLYLGIKKECVTELDLQEHDLKSILAAQEKERGIVFDEVFEALSLTEREIHKKSMKLWDNHQSNVDLSKTLVAAVSLDFPKTIPPQVFDGYRTPIVEGVVAQNNAPVMPSTPSRSVDGIFRKKEVGAGIVAPEGASSQPKTGVDAKITVAEAPPPIQNFEQHSFPLKFEGKDIDVVRGEADGSNANTIKVIFDGKEIARGAITEKGSEVVLNAAFKRMPLMAETDEERALRFAASVLGTFKKI